MHDLVGRLFGVVRKEVVELLRQPGLLFVMVLGPLLILATFGSGVRSTDPTLRATFVVSGENEELDDSIRGFADSQSERLDVNEVTDDEDEAMRQLRSGEVQVVVVAPKDPLATLEGGERAVVEVRHGFIDPLEAQAIRLFTRTAVDEINDLIVEYVVTESQVVAEAALDEAEDLEALTNEADVALDDDEGAVITIEDLRDITQLSPRLFARPLEGEARAFGGAVDTTDFYAPAVVALILQHLTLTFVAMSNVRERELGMTEILAVSPLRSVESAVGKVLAYLLVGAVLSAAMVTLFATVLGVPIRGGVLSVVVVLAIEILGSIGLGFLLGRVSVNTTQVVQGSMLLLLTSVFFGGLLLSSERLLPWARPVGWGLPMTHAIPLLRDTMLRGGVLDAGLLQALAGSSVVFLLLGIGLESRRRALR